MKSYYVRGSKVYVAEDSEHKLYAEYAQSRKGYAEAHETARAMNRIERGEKPQYRSFGSRKRRL